MALAQSNRRRTRQAVVSDCAPPTHELMLAHGTDNQVECDLFADLQALNPAAHQRKERCVSGTDIHMKFGRSGWKISFQYTYDNGGTIVTASSQSAKSVWPKEGYTVVQSALGVDRVHHSRAEAIDAAIFQYMHQYGFSANWAKYRLRNLEFVVLRKQGKPSKRREKTRQNRRKNPEYMSGMVLYRSGSPRTVKIASLNFDTYEVGPPFIICDDWLAASSDVEKRKRLRA